MRSESARRGRAIAQVADRTATLTGRAAAHEAGVLDQASESSTPSALSAPPGPCVRMISTSVVNSLSPRCSLARSERTRGPHPGHSSYLSALKRRTTRYRAGVMMTSTSFGSLSKTRTVRKCLPYQLERVQECGEPFREKVCWSRIDAVTYRVCKLVVEDWRQTEGSRADGTTVGTRASCP